MAADYLERRGVVAADALKGEDVAAVRDNGAEISLRASRRRPPIRWLPQSDEIELLARRGVAVAHNPVSNLFLGDGIAPVAELLDAGVVVALGTDGASSNGTQDPWESLKAAVLLSRVRANSRWLTPREGLRMATINGARAIGMADVIGSLEVGKRADIALVEIGHAAHAVGSHDVRAHLVYSARAADVRTVLVDGRVVVDKKRLVAADASGLVSEARQRATGLAQRLLASA